MNIEDFLQVYKTALDQTENYLKYASLMGLDKIAFNPPDEQAQNKQKWSEIEQEIKNCKLCSLHQGRNNVVVGDGSHQARLMFIGEAPGAEEDRQGLPFVGRAGQLLNNMIKAMKMERSEVYIGNVLKCRPPENRTPLPEEIHCCEPYLMHQIELIKPRVICALGAIAAQTLLQRKDSLTQLRGQFYDWYGILLMPTYHPAYLLRNPQAKRGAWQDLQAIQKVLKA